MQELMFLGWTISSLSWIKGSMSKPFKPKGVFDFMKVLSLIVYKSMLFIPGSFTAVIVLLASCWHYLSRKSHRFNSTLNQLHGWTESLAACCCLVNETLLVHTVWNVKLQATYNKNLKPSSCRFRAFCILINKISNTVSAAC